MRKTPRLLLLTLLSLILPLPAQSADEPAAAPAADPAKAAETTAPADPASPASVTPDNRKSSPSIQQWVRWLPPTLPAHEVEWLRDNSVFSLYFPQLTAEGKGSVLLIPAAGQHAAWPDHIRALSEQLPPNGWSVLIVTPSTPTPPPAPKPAADTTPKTDGAADPAAAQPAAAEPETATAEAAATGDDNSMSEVLQAGLTLLESKGQKNTIVIGMGDGGMDAVMLAHKSMGTESSVKGLVLADMSALMRPAQKLSEIFRLHPIVVLDIVHPQYRDAQRLRAAQLKQFPQYYAVQMPEPMADIQQSNDRFARRVRGWLTRYAAGEQKSGPKAAAPASPAAPASTPAPSAAPAAGQQ